MKLYFETTDLYLASALSILTNIHPTLSIKHNERVVFCFEANDSLYKAISDYNQGIKLSAIDYAETIKKLRAEMIIKRNRNRGDKTSETSNFRKP